MQPKTVNLVYWISTILFAALMIFSAIGGLKPTQESIAFMHDQLGYPIYFIRFLSVAKLVGALVILEQRFPRVREWAYAGLMFDLVGALVSVIAVSGKLEPGAGFIVFAILLGMTSYIMGQKRTEIKAMRKS